MTIEQYYEVIRLYNLGVEDCDIADEVGIDESAVADVIDKYEGVAK